MSDKPLTVLHILSQRPGRTGSGVTVEALVRNASAKHYTQHVIVGTPLDDPSPAIANLDPLHVHPVVFETPELPFRLPGMSDVMPYPTTRWSTLTMEQLDTYKRVWKSHISKVIQQVQPDLIHSHHIWIVSSLLKDITDLPVVSHCHATGLRQMDLCDTNLAEAVQAGCRRNDRFLVLHGIHQSQLASTLNVPVDRIHVVGGGYRETVFHSRGRGTNAQRQRDNDDKIHVHLVFAGKISHSKGLPWLLDAVEQIVGEHDSSLPKLFLHIAGSGSGAEADELQARMERMKGTVQMHGMISQDELADLLRQSDIFVLPSLYEGLPLVLVEAAACGCRLICTKLPGVMEQLYEPLRDVMELVDLPRLTIDVPEPDDLPVFVSNLKEAIMQSARQGPPGDTDTKNFTDVFTWKAVFERVETVWKDAVVSRSK